MLRVIKRKLQELPVIDKKVALTWETKKTTRDASQTSLPLDSSDSTTRIVSHVPVSTKTSTSSFGSSSTISTHCHPTMQPPPGMEAINGSGCGESPLLSSVVSIVMDDATKPKESSFKEATSAGESTGGVKRAFISQNIQDVKRPRVEAKESALSRSPEMLCLSTVKDASALSPLHIFVRQQIEVFQATEEDLKQPAPGRRIPIQPNQVGLRCIHCKHQKSRERKKRAVCYPSSVGRVYHSVSDMKFAHFPCQQMSEVLQQTFATLKEESLMQSKLIKESSPTKKTVGSTTASTAQYYHDSARTLGVVDGKGGIYAVSNGSIKSVPTVENLTTAVLQTGQQTELAMTYAALAKANALQGILLRDLLPIFPHRYVPTNVLHHDKLAIAKIQRNAAADRSDAGVAMAMADHAKTTKAVPKAVPVVLTSKTHKKLTEKPAVVVQKLPQVTITGSRQGSILASEMDQNYLTPIHCFVRRHVEVFSANEQDLAAPAPGRKKPIVLGQVGLRCVHCASLPVKQRVKRAICFPPSVSGVYHAVSNMKCDHFKLCKGIPQEARAEFQQISTTSQSSSSSTGVKRGRGYPKSRPSVSNSTAQYYHDSALRMGLCDTEEGMRFGPADGSDDPCCEVGFTSMAAQQAEGMDALVIAATDPEVRAAHEKRRPRRSAALFSV